VQSHVAREFIHRHSSPWKEFRLELQATASPVRQLSMRLQAEIGRPNIQADMNYKVRVLKRYLSAKLVKTCGERDSFGVSDGDIALSELASTATEAWRQAALAIDHPYSDADSRWRDPGTED
jgi:hypothetical protein